MSHTDRANNMKVSVLMITYNHEHFIAQAIESVLMQETDFEYEVVIGEDYSTDTTRDIALSYQRRYPDKIRLLLPDTNLGMNRNFIETIGACSGKYIAMLEGDDYWTTPYKLQEQINFMERYPGCSISFHNVTVYDETKHEVIGEMRSNIVKELLELEDILVNNYLHTSSAVFKNGLFENDFQWLSSVMNLDTTIYILCALQGQIGYIDKTMGRYRIHSGGIWSQLNNVRKFQELIKTYGLINTKLAYRYDKTLGPFINSLTFSLAQAYENSNNDYVNAKLYLTKCIKGRPLSNKFLPRSHVLRMIFRLYLPTLYKLSKKLGRRFYGKSNLSSKNVPMLDEK